MGNQTATETGHSPWGRPGDSEGTMRAYEINLRALNHGGGWNLVLLANVLKQLGGPSHQALTATVSQMVEAKHGWKTGESNPRGAATW